MNEAQLSLLQLNNIIKKTVNENFNSKYWVVAEISDIRENYSGHCYLELIQKDENNNNIVAKARANIWANTYRILKPYFETSTKTQLSSGIKILILVTIEFHELYGFSLTIYDIEPSFTIGDIELKKAKIIEQLVKDGIFEMNKELEFPIVPQRVAVISSDTAAGYEDFCKQLNNNRNNFKFNIVLFQAFMQGEQAESSIVGALDKINNKVQQFDVVAIIRGGGGKSDLSCFDNYQIASNICQFPIPVLSGIGHQRDNSIVDMVSNENLKTPTAVADFIIEKTEEFYNSILFMNDNIMQYATNMLDNKNNELYNLIQKLKNEVLSKNFNQKEKFFNLSNNLTKNVYNVIYYNNTKYNTLRSKIKVILSSEIKSNKTKLVYENEKLLNSINQYIEKNKSNINTMERLVNQNNIKTVLGKGFSITKLNNKTLKNKSEAISDQLIETELYDGIIKSQIL